MARKTITVIAIVSPVPKFHVVNTPKNAEDHKDEWDFFVPGHLFEAVEHQLVKEGIAHNLVSLNELRACGNSVDYECVYNEAE